MGSPLGPTLANVFLSYHEKIQLQNCPSEFKPVIYRTYVDDTFLLFRSKYHIEKFRKYLNCQHKNIRFTSETKNENSISFLDIKISRDKFTTSVYGKPTFSGVLTNFGSFILISYKYNLPFNSLHRAFKLCSNFELFHQEIDKLKTIFKTNGYPKSFADLCIKKYFEKVFIKKKVVLTASKKELICFLPFIGNKSLQLRNRLVNSIENNLKFCKLKVIFQSPCQLSSPFRYKDSLKKEIGSDVAYRYTFSNCKVTYYGKTYHHFFTRVAEHMDISNLTGKRLKTAKKSAISDHLLNVTVQQTLILASSL